MVGIIGLASLSVMQGDFNIVFIGFLHYSETVFNNKSHYLLRKFNNFLYIQKNNVNIQILYNYLIHSNSD